MHIKHLINIAKDASKFLLRDYLELGRMQQAFGPRTESFSHRAIRHCQRYFSKELNCKIVFADEVIQTEQTNPVKDEYSSYESDRYFDHNTAETVHIRIIDNFANLVYALPFIATVVLYKDENNPQSRKALINLVAMDQIYYVVEREGAYVECVGYSSKIRLTRLKPAPNRILTGLSNPPPDLSLIGRTGEKINYAHNIIMNAPAYCCSLLASNRADYFYIPDENKIDPVTQEVISLLLTEAGAENLQVSPAGKIFKKKLI